MVIDDVLKLGTVCDLLHRDGPITCLLKSLGDRFCNFTNSVARTIAGNGTMDAAHARASAKPCICPVFGGCKAVNVCGQRANDLLGAIADDLKDDAFRRLFNTGPVVIAAVLKLRDFKVKGDGNVGNTTLEFNDARIADLIGADGVAPAVI